MKTLTSDFELVCSSKPVPVLETMGVVRRLSIVGPNPKLLKFEGGPNGDNGGRRDRIVMLFVITFGRLLLSMDLRLFLGLAEGSEVLMQLRQADNRGFKIRDAHRCIFLTIKVVEHTPQVSSRFVAQIQIIR